MTQTKGMLWDAFQAAHRLGEADLPGYDVAFRLALNKNHLKPVHDAIDEARLKMAKEHGVAETVKAESQEQVEDFHIARERFVADWTAFRDTPVEQEFVSPAKIDVQRLSGDVKVKPNDLAALLAVGILTNGDGAE